MGQIRHDLLGSTPMNRIYNLVFNRALGQVKAVSEFAHRRRGAPTRARRGRRVAVVLYVLALGLAGLPARSEEHTSELQSLMRISYAVFCLKKNNIHNI